MEKRTIEDIAYLINQSKEKGENKPIIFLGAGASQSAGIPLTGKIVADILEQHKNKPSIERLNDSDKNNYYKLMSALSAQERRRLFSSYINNKEVKLNVTNIYLAQLLNEGYVDYILTVNFDDLILKSCALFNYIPPVYDISVLTDFTTTNFLEKSVTYLHGQHHGQWLLNAEGELSKIASSIPKLFDRICHDRTWIIIGYSGEDDLVNEIAKIGSFENELYWVGYNDNLLSEKVQKELFERPRMNAYHIKGFDSDSFFLRLHAELKLDTPKIFNRPFSFLQEMMEQVTDIKVDDKKKDKELFYGIKDRMEISKKQVIYAIENIEKKAGENETIQIIIEKTIKEDFSEEEAKRFENEIISNKYTKAYKTLGNYYNAWGDSILRKADIKNSLELYEESILKYTKAIEFITDSSLLNNWGSCLFRYGKLKGDEELIEKSIEKFNEALSYNNNDMIIYGNKAAAISNLGVLRKDKGLFVEAFEIFEKVYNLKPNDVDNLDNWSGSLLYYYHLCNNTEKKEVINEVFDKANKVYSLDGCSYNLSCAYALQLEKDKALKYLKEALDRKSVTIKYVNDDYDWDAYRNDEDFINLLNDYKLKHKP